MSSLGVHAGARGADAVLTFMRVMGVMSAVYIAIGAGGVRTIGTKAAVWPITTQEEASALLEFLDTRLTAGSAVVSFNGAARDLRAVIDMAPDHPAAERLLMGHTDLLLAFSESAGYRAKLSSFICTRDFECSSEGATERAEAIEAVHTAAVNTGFVARVAETSGKVGGWHLRSGMEHPPIRVRTVAEIVDANRKPPAWVSEPISAAASVTWWAAR